MHDNLTPPLAIVIPARNAERLLPECLDALAAQLRAGDSLVVVDDASTDGTAKIAARHGAEVIRRRIAGGPYAARNDGWRATDQSYVLFTDARCVARENLLTRVREATRDHPDLIFSDVLVRSGHRLAERAAAERQHLRVEYYASGMFLPFYPTACLAVPRDALELVQGFRLVESGGDADLCWRIQLADRRHLHDIGEPLMEWRPRATVPSLVQQWVKYGRSNARLRYAYRAHGATIPPPRPALQSIVLHARRALSTLRRGPLVKAPVVCVDAMMDLAFDISYGKTMRGLQREPPSAGTLAVLGDGRAPDA